jgi:tetratricopeptide (TPR) repeat protein
MTGIQRVEVPLGRETQIAAFRAAVARVEQGQPAGLLFSGEDGSGRTYWLNWMRQEAGEHSWTTMLGRCDERVRDNPYQPFFSALGLTFDKNGEIINDRSVESVIDQISLPDVISAVSNIPGIGAVVAFGLIGKAVLDGHRRPLEGEALLNRNFEFMRQTLSQVYQKQHQPLFVGLDDLHMASGTSFALIRHLLTRNPDVPLLIAITWDSSVPVPNDLVGLVAQHPLPRLAPAECERLIARLSGGPAGRPRPAGPPASRPQNPGALLRSLWPRPGEQAPPQAAPAPAGTPVALALDQVKNLIEFSHGLPGLIVEGYGLLQETGGNVLEAATGDTNLMVRVIAERHLARVPVESRPLLMCAAQLGQRFALDAISAPRLQEYLGMSERRILEIAIDLAAEGRVLRYADEDALEFTSAHLSNYLRGGVAGALSKRDRLRVAEAGAQAHLPPGALAAHFFAGGDYAHALENALSAAEISLRDLAYPEATEDYCLALRAYEQLAAGTAGGEVLYRGTPLDRLELLRSASFAAERAGDWAQAAELLAQALPLAANNPGRAADIEAQLGWLAHSRGQMQEALGHLQAAGERYGALDDARGLAKVRYYEGVLHVAHKAWTRAAEALHESIAAAERAGDAAIEVEALAHLELGNLHRQQRAWADAERILLAGQALAERSGDAYAQAQSYHYLGMVYGRQERPEAIPMLERARTIARDQVKQPALQAMIENTLAESLVRARRWADAEESFHTSERLKAQLGDVAGLAMTYGGLARLFHRQWRFEPAIEYYRKDLAMLERDAEANVAFRQQIHNTLGEVLRLAGKLSEAEAEFLAGQALTLQIPDPGERARSDGYTRLGLARVALDAGDLERAEREWTAAEPLLRGTWMEPELERVQCWLRRRQKRFDDARAALARAAAVVDVRGEDYEKLQLAIERARLARDSGDAAGVAPARARASEAADALQNHAARELLAREFGGG